MPDALSTFVSQLGLRGSVFGRVVLASPWGLQQERFPEMMFHLLLRGECYIAYGRTPGQFKRFRPGDFVLFPGGMPHAFASSPDTPLVPTERVCFSTTNEFGDRIQRGRGAKSEFICGSFSVTGPHAEILIDSLPEVIEFSSEGTARHRWIRSTLELLAHEVAEREAGSSLLIDQLLDTLFVQILRWYDSVLGSKRAGFFRALRDPSVMRSLALISEQYSREWNVESLARACGLSRTALATKFRSAVGQGVAGFLRDYRLQRATRMLQESTCSIKEIAHKTGFASSEVFIRNFQRVYRVSPQRFRRVHASANERAQEK